MNKEMINNRLCEIEIMQNALLFYNDAEQVEDETEQMIYDSAYESLGEEYIKLVAERERS